MGQFGESLIRNFERVRGNTVFDLNVGEHGIDGLVRQVGPDGRVEFKVIEVKTLQKGTDFQLNDTKAGKQLSRQWIMERLTTGATKHPDPETRKAAAEALEQFLKNSTSIKAELHGISVGDNRYIVRGVDSATATIKAEIATDRVTDMLKNLSERASSEEVRRMATRNLAEFDQFQVASKPRIVKGGDLPREMGNLAGVKEEQMSEAVKEAAEHIKAPGQSRWVKAGGRVFKFIGRVAGPAGVVIGVVVFTAEAADIEQKFESGTITREQADKELAMLGVQATGTAGGAVGGVMAGAAIGTFICPGAGTVIGGIVGGVGGAIAADLVMAATGLTDTLAEYMQPGVESVRNACTYLKYKGYQITVAGRKQLCKCVSPELFDETIAVLGGAVDWVQDCVWEAAVTVKDAAVATKDLVVDTTGVVCEVVANGASWLWDNGKSGYSTIRSWLP